MTIGCTARYDQLEKISQIAQAGFDYVETNLVALEQASDAEFNAFLGALAENSIPCPVANRLFPSNMRLVGENVNITDIADYLERAFNRAKRVGIKTVAFSGGGVRRLPDDLDRAQAYERLEEVFRCCIEPVCEKYDIDVAIENLSTNETNVFNRVGEIVEYVERLGCKRIFAMCNNYHMVAEGEEYSTLRKLKDKICHVHISNPDRRKYPTVNDEHDYSELFDALRAINYDKGVTVEVGVPDDENTEECIYASSILLKTVV